MPSTMKQIEPDLMEQIELDLTRLQNQRDKFNEELDKSRAVILKATAPTTFIRPFKERQKFLVRNLNKLGYRIDRHERVISVQNRAPKP